ncbi:hypothetical protein D3C78_1044420 [compost metagenome]
MAGGACLTRLHLRHIGQLTHAGQRIEFAEEGDDRLAAAEFADEGRFHACHAAANRKAIFLKRCSQNAGRLPFFEFQLGKIPDTVAQGGEIGLHRLDFGGNRHHGITVHGLSSHFRPLRARASASVETPPNPYAL